MATVQTIATTLTADARPFSRGFSEAGRSADKLGMDLERLEKNFATKMDRMARTSAVGGGRGGKAAGGFIELSRGIEDFSAAFQTGGLQGGLRGASNNLSQMAFVMGGPVAGAIAGLTVAALPSLVKWLGSTEDAAENAKKSLEFFGEQLKKQQGEAQQQAQFAGVLDDSNTVDDLNKEIKERERLIKEAEAQEQVLQQQRESEAALRNQGINNNVYGFGAPGTIFGKATGQDIFGNNTEKFDKSLEREKKIHEEQMKLVEDRAKAEEQLNDLFAKRNELKEQEQKQAEIDMLGKRVDADKRRQGEVADNDRRRKELEEEIKRLTGQDAAGGRGQLAAVATVNSQSLLRSQYQAKEAAEAKAQRQKQIAAAETMIRKLDEIRRELVGAADTDDVNLN